MSRGLSEVCVCACERKLLTASLHIDLQDVCRLLLFKALVKDQQ